MKINKMSHSRMRSGFAGRASFCGLVVVLVAALLCPAGWDASVYAEGDNPDIINSASEEGSQATDTNEPVALSDDADAGIDMLAATAGITIDGDADNKQVTVAPGETGYREHTVQLTGSDISAYTLKISGTPNLTGPNGSTTVTGAGGNTPAAMSDNTWGYAWGATGTAKESMSYQSVTSAGTALTADPVSGTTLNSTRKLAFAAKFGASNIAGRYTGTVTLSMVATPVAAVRTLTYNGNNGTPATQTKTCDDYGTGCNITSSYTTPTRSGYDFLGWADSSSATSANASYNSGATITISGDKTIYAVWKSQDPWGSITTMQQMTSSACSAASIGKSKTLTDSRDNSSYTVQKYPDGKCWMTQNLKISGKSISSSDSDVSSNYSIPSSSTSGFSSDTAQNVYVTNNTGYYTWCAATAGTCSSATSQGANAPSSICPKGWKLPVGYQSDKNNNDFWKLFRNMGLTISNDSLASTSGGYTSWGTGDLAKVQGSPYNFAYTGYVLSGTFYDPSSNPYGYWWSRTAYNSTQAYALYVDSGVVYPGTYYNYRRLGFAVRCVAQ